MDAMVKQPAPERRRVPLTVLVTETEADRLREVMFRSRRRLSSWLRDLALREAAKLERER